jgi:hypothetical protein
VDIVLEGGDSPHEYFPRSFVSLAYRLCMFRNVSDFTENDLLVSCQVYGEIGIYFPSFYYICSNSWIVSTLTCCVLLFYYTRLKLSVLHILTPMHIIVCLFKHGSIYLR